MKWPLVLVATLAASCGRAELASQDTCKDARLACPELDEWLSPSHELPGYHVLCVSARAEADMISLDFGEDREIKHDKHSQGIAVFREGRAEADMISLDFDEDWESLRVNLAWKIGISRHTNPWHDAGKFFQLCRNGHVR